MTETPLANELLDILRKLTNDELLMIEAAREINEFYTRLIKESFDDPNS